MLLYLYSAAPSPQTTIPFSPRWEESEDWELGVYRGIPWIDFVSRRSCDIFTLLLSPLVRVRGREALATLDTLDRLPPQSYPRGAMYDLFSTLHPLALRGYYFMS